MITYNKDKIRSNLVAMNKIRSLKLSSLVLISLLFTGCENKMEKIELNDVISIEEDVKELNLKEELEDMGLKVHITRDEDIYLNSYGVGGRALLANDNHAKYSFSIHFNSGYGIMKSGGVEVYTPNDIDYTLAKEFIDEDIQAYIDFLRQGLSNYKK